MPMNPQEEKAEKLKILDFLDPTSVAVELTATNKKGVLEELTGMLAKSGKVKDAKATVDILLEREKLGSTGIGQGIAIPHAKTDQTTQVTASFGLSRKGVQFDSLDGEPVYIFFLLVAPPDAAGQHLKALARISRLLKDKFFRQALRDVKDVSEVLKIIREEDQY
jgi:PTS system nitrogen regulatory IIA component